MNATLGRRLIEAAPDDRATLHVEAWPPEQAAYQEVVGRVLGAILGGEQVITVTERTSEAGQTLPSELTVNGLDEPVRQLLARRLPPPPPPDRHRPASKAFARWAVELPRAVRLDPKFARSWAPERTKWVELGSGTEMLIVFVIAPIMEALCQVFRVRSHEGPKTLKQRVEAVERCLETHETLGIDPGGVRPLLEPGLDAAGVQEARSRLIESWAAHPPDLGARAMALLCTDLARRYYAKARKDGSAHRAQVVTSTVEPLLDVTLADWEELLTYLGEAESEVDASPLELSEISVPAAPPPAVARRVDVVRRWWTEVFDPVHAAQTPQMPEPWGLVPSPHPFEIDEASSDQDEAQGGYDPQEWTRYLPEGMRQDIDDLWGTTVLARYPNVLVDAPHPEAHIAAILEPATRVWESLLLTPWYLCFGPYSRTTLDGIEEYERHSLDLLADLGCPIDHQVFRDLEAAGHGVDWLFEQSFGITFSLTISEDGEPEMATEEPGQAKPGADGVFLGLRDVVTAHRRQWMAHNLDKYLEARWRQDLLDAAEAYRELHIGRGKPPTVKQAYPKLNRAATAWFGGDLSQLAQCLHLEGPVTEPMRRTALQLPEDMPQLRRRVNELLGGDANASWDEGWEERRRFELAQHVGAVLAQWQASGEMPNRPAAMGGRVHLLKEAFPGTDPENAYLQYVGAIYQALSETRHPAAEAPLARGRR